MVIKKIVKKASAKTAKKKTATKTTRPRKKTLSKISSEELFSLIEKKAYEMFEQNGFTHGDDQYHWFEAEKAVLSTFKK